MEVTESMLEDYETFTEKERALIEQFVTNTTGSVFALRNMPEVIKGALFSRYSRSTLGLRSLLLKEFIQDADQPLCDQMTEGASEQVKEQELAIKKAQNFYDRILDGYGDDSIGELGGAHLAMENLSMLAAKAIEDRRIGGSPLEKSTRYIYFDQKVQGEYLYYREPVLMTSAYKTLYIETCDMLFDTYKQLIPPLTLFMKERFPKDEATSKVAYTASIRAKVLDCLRGLLPASTLTNVGLFGNGRFFEYLIQKLQVNELTELQDLGKQAFEELSKVIPSFVRRGEMGHRHYKAFATFYEAMEEEIEKITELHTDNVSRTMEEGVRLLAADPDDVYKVAGALLYPYSDKGLEELITYARTLDDEELNRVLDAAATCRENRRHKPPRALEHATFSFEYISDFGAYRDLQRHRLLTQERQRLTTDYGYYVPQEIIDAGLEKPYREALEKGKQAFEEIQKELPIEAQYVVPMAYNVRWYFKANLRSLIWLCELRSAPQGHAVYRKIAQNMVQQIIETIPQFERFFKFVDFDGHDLGRLAQEERKVQLTGN